MEWYWILLIVLASLFVLTFVGLFILYMTNADLHLVEKIYDWLIKYQNKKNVKTKL